MLVAREVLHLLAQVLGYSWRARKPGLWLLIVAGALLVLLATATTAAAPVLIYPVL